MNIDTQSLLSVSQWYALRTASRHEHMVRRYLEKQAIEVFLPTYSRISYWKDRKKNIESPLFPGYCFGRFCWADRLKVVTTPGLAWIVGNRMSGTPILEKEIFALKRLVDTDLAIDPHPYLHEGMEVHVVRGPLLGSTGILIRKKSEFRLVLSIQLINQAVSAEINSADVVVVGNQSSIQDVLFAY